MESAYSSETVTSYQSRRRRIVTDMYTYIFLDLYKQNNFLFLFKNYWNRSSGQRLTPQCSSKDASLQATEYTRNLRGRFETQFLHAMMR
jgi:hypothetical protein